MRNGFTNQHQACHRWFLIPTLRLVTIGIIYMNMACAVKYLCIKKNKAVFKKIYASKKQNAETVESDMASKL